MSQFFTRFSILLLLAFLNPIVCPSSKIFSERRDRSPYIEPAEHSSQYLSDTVGSRSRKVSAHYKEQSTLQENNSPKIEDHEVKDSVVDENIRSVFSTNFGPGLYLFKNTAPFVNQTHFNSYNDQMVGDQPIAYAPPPSPPLPSSPSASDKQYFKVQRSPDGNLSVVYNEDYVPKAEKDKTNHSTAKQHSDSHKEKTESRFQTHVSAGLPLKKDKQATASPTPDSAIHFPTEEPDIGTRSSEPVINDCLEEEEVKNNKSFCSHLRNYPENNRLEDLIKKKFPNLEYFFGEDLVLPQNISQRMNNDPNEEYLCRSRVRVIYPQSGQNKDWDWIYIVNSPQYKQGIRIEECLEPYKTCGENTGLSLPNRFTATCEQSYIYRSLIAYNNDTIFKDSFRIPSCCKCVLRSY